MVETLETEGTENNYLEVKILLNLVEKQQKEIEEKTTIIMAGAEKVKQLEKGNRSLMESRKKWKNRYYKEKAKNKECISKDKIKEKIKEQRQKYFDIYDGKHSINEICFESIKVEGAVEVLKELLEEN